MRAWSARLIVMALVAAASGHGITAFLQDARGSYPSLEPGQTVESALSGGQLVGRSITLAAGQSATIVVAHRAIDVVVRVFETRAEPDIDRVSDGHTGELRLRVHATRSGSHAIEIAAAYAKSPPGACAIRVESVRQATTADQQLSDAEAQHSRAARLRTIGAYRDGLEPAERALALREQALGLDAPEVARSLLVLAQLNDGAARFGVADGLYVRARRILESLASDAHDLLKAAILDSHATHSSTVASFPEAERLAKEALAIRERVLGPDHPLVAASFATLADIHHAGSNMQAAHVAADRALAIADRRYAATDLARGEFVNRAARAQLAAGNFARAEELYQESYRLSEQAAGAESLAAAGSLGGLARVALQANDNVRAEERHRRSLAIKERILGPEHPEVAGDVFNLGLLHYRRRDYTTAVERYLRARRIWEQTLGPRYPLIAFVFNNLGLVYWRQGDYGRAEQSYERAVELSADLYGADSLRVANPLANLGIIAKETGNYALAETRYQRALAIMEKHLGPDHPQLIVTVESLGILYRDTGEYPRAAEMFRRVMNITVATMGPEHPIAARHLGNIARLHWATGDWEQAFAAQQRLIAIGEHNLPLNLSTGSERQKLAYFEPFLQNLQETISFHVQRPGDDARARELAVTTLLQRKGRVLDALADSRTAFRTRSRPEDQAILDRLAKVTSELAAAVLGDSTRSPLAERQQRAATLAAERERLEADMHRRSAGYLEPSRPVTLTAVQNAVPPDAALLEFFVYRPFDARSSFETGKQFGAARYVAYVIRQSGGIGWKELGPAEEIDSLADRFRGALADPARRDAATLAERLHEKVLAPLQPLVGDSTHLLISPDGPLNLVPFEALRGVSGRYVIEDRAVTYVTTGRDLVRLLSPRPAPSRSAIFADPAFGEPAAHRAGARSITAGQDFSSVYFAPLAGTAGEARRIHALFPETDLRVGARATEQALKRLQAPRILHIATHGFFLQDIDSPEAQAGPSGTREVTANARIDNPLLRSGLAFAGANLPRQGGDDGILTALEAANLNLWGTQVVTLSACDTGVGVVRNGEGVYGLRRAFFLAGAETLVMSLWPVSDQVTREMMTGYYAGLEEGLGRGAALRRVQLRMLKRPGRVHPFYWASFIQAGQWASLDDRR